MKQNNIRGLYAITPDEANTGILLTKVAAALEGGAQLLQYRNKMASPALAQEQAQALSALCQDYGIPLIINDDPELAFQVGAQGVHLGKTDTALQVARQLLGNEAIIGISCYNRLDLAEAAQRQGADYVAFGACFPSSTKPEAVKAGLHLFQQAKKLRIPTVAIGGITLKNAASVAAAGANAQAIISALWESTDIRQTAHAFSNLILNTRH